MANGCKLHLQLLTRQHSRTYLKLTKLLESVSSHCPCPIYGLWISAQFRPRTDSMEEISFTFWTGAVAPVSADIL